MKTHLKTDRVYIPCEALRSALDFEVWYEDGDILFSVERSGTGEADQLAIIGRLGGEIGSIRADNLVLTQRIRMERYEYILHTICLFEHYTVEGMLWDARGSLERLPLDFVNEATQAKDVHVRLVDFRAAGPCYEVKVKDVAKLRIAAAVVIALGIKEANRGKSEGEEVPNASLLQKLKARVLTNKGIPYEDLIAEGPRS